LYAKGRAPAGVTLEDAEYRVRSVAKGAFKLQGGGEVVGEVPQGLPEFKLPHFTWDAFMSVLSAAIVISLVGFMEAISIAKAIAAKTKERLDPNQELVGQGLANLVGSFSQSYPVSGSFSRSAVNMNAGAKTGMSSVFTALIVLVALLFLTPLLYHLPQAVLGAVIIMAVVGLVNIDAVKHACTPAVTTASPPSPPSSLRWRLPRTWTTASWSARVWHCLVSVSHDVAARGHFGSA